MQESDNSSPLTEDEREIEIQRQLDELELLRQR